MQAGGGRETGNQFGVALLVSIVVFTSLKQIPWTYKQYFSNLYVSVLLEISCVFFCALYKSNITTPAYYLVRI